MNIRQNSPNAAPRPFLRRAALFPALFLALALTGCAKGGGKENDSPVVFETQFHSPEGGVEDFTVYGDSVYYSTFDGEFYQWTPGGEAKKLDIEPFTIEVDDCLLQADRRLLQADHQGNLYVFYHVPNPLKSDFCYLVKYDAAGKELARQNVSLLTSQFSPYETAVDGEGRLYLKGMDKLLLFDGTCSYIGAVNPPEGEDPIWLAGDAAGHVYCDLYSSQDNDIIREVVWDGQGGSQEGSQDASSQDAQIASFGDPLGEARLVNNLVAYGENRFLTYGDNALYLYDLTSNTLGLLLQWANCDINPASVARIATLADGRIVARLEEGQGSGELAVVTEAPREQAAEKEVITLGVLQAGNRHLLRCISQFNRDSADYRIEIREYYDIYLDSGQAEAKEEARNALHLDISSGRCPDLLVLEYDDLEAYAAKGLLEDLAPYLEADGSLELADNVLEAYTFHGKLCALPGALQIRTLAGRTERLGELGNAMGWTLEEMMGFIDSNPDSTVFSADAGQLLEYSLVFNQSHFVDWEAHACDFTSDEFIRLLEFCGRFSGRKGTEGAEVLDMMDKSNIALLHEVELVRPQDIVLLAQILGTEDISYVGFPTVDGRAGSLLEDCGGTCAISAKSKHKEAAWAFVELLLTGWDDPPKSYSALVGTKGFPTELGTRERYFAKVTENPYRISEDGEIYMQDGKPERYAHHIRSSRALQVFFYTPLPEETDLICTLLDSSTTARGGRQISSIVAQEAEGYFSGQKSAADVAALIQNRVSVYLAEQE
ncbi:MAG: extracellular solute-binding protein [Lachnospiraceae bacterium]|nr:extracellular solute-binding protein [Lachnospiraceae bacterium]